MVVKKESIVEKKESISICVCVAGELCRNGCWASFNAPFPSTDIQWHYEFFGMFGVQYERSTKKDQLSRRMQGWLELTSGQTDRSAGSRGPW
jgi:hypothetical protein